MNIDSAIFNFLNGFAGKNIFLDKAAVFFAEYFQYVLALVFLAFVFKNFRKYLPMTISAGVSVFLSRIVITEILRHFFFRLRPFVDNQAILLINQSPREASFPSGHATLFFALSMAVYYYNKKFGIVLFVSSIFISLSRVFAGVHWPSDILVGAVIGILSGWLINKVFRNAIQKFSDKILLIIPAKKKPL
jgi:undecaprenyl-diphosphatase